MQGVAGAYDLATDFLAVIRAQTEKHGALLIADEVQSGMGRCGEFFAIQLHDIEPDIVSCAKGLGGGLACGAVLCSDAIAAHFGPGDLGSTFGGGPIAAAAITAVIDTINAEGLLENVRKREAQIRSRCSGGVITRIQGKGLLLGLVSDRPATNLRDALLEQDILTGTSAAPNVLRILAPLILQQQHVDQLAQALSSLESLN